MKSEKGEGRRSAIGERTKESEGVSFFFGRSVKRFFVCVVSDCSRYVFSAYPFGSPVLGSLITLTDVSVPIDPKTDDKISGVVPAGRP